MRILRRCSRGSLVRSRFRSAPQHGFTLVEVTIALGIFSFALVAILGLMPAAMKATRQSMEISTTTRIAGQLASRLGQQPFSTLADEGPLYFDDAGETLGNSNQAIYQATISLGNVILDTNSPSPSANLKRASIEIQSVGNPNAPRKFSFFIFNQGT